MFPFLKFDTPERRAHALGMGPVRFVLLYGILAWGGLMAVTFSLLAPALGFVPGPDADLGYLQKVVRGAPLAFAVFLSGGVLWGASMWYVIGVVQKKQSTR